jgi:hypothetical protein
MPGRGSSKRTAARRRKVFEEDGGEAEEGLRHEGAAGDVAPVQVPHVALEDVVQVEVYDPQPGRALSLIRSGAIVPIG